MTSAIEIATQLRPIKREEAVASYADLVAYDCTTDPVRKRYGLKALDHFFFHHRLQARTKRHISFVEAMRDSAHRARLEELVVRWKKATNTPQHRLNSLYEVFQLYYGTINQFRPAVAKAMYCTLGARRGILDFSAGWGGRALAAMSLNIPYIGIDANKDLKPAYEAMVRTYNPTASVRMFFQPAETVDFSQFTYDLVFTSPPYFMLEEYSRMPAYVDKANFVARFFAPVIRRAWRGLPVGGHMALNMPHEMYLAIKDELPPLHTTFRLALADRHAKNAARRAKLGTMQEEGGEAIYVWRKGRQGTRKQTRKQKQKKLRERKTRKRKVHVTK